MVDNVAITPGAGATVAADDVGGALHQRVKISLGADGVAVDAGAGAGVVGTDTQRVTLANDDVLVARLPTSVGAKTGAESLSVVPNSDTTFPVGGNVAGGAADSGNPLKVGAVYNSTLPTYASGQRTELQTGTRGHLNVTIFGPNSTNSAIIITNADATSNANSSLVTASFGYAYNGATWDRARGDTSGLVTQPHALTGSRIQYPAAAGGINNTTTAVTMFAAAGGSLRNYITGLQIMADALGAATELAIRDGAGGTVIWRSKIGTSGQALVNIDFPVPLKGTANTLLEVVTLTASVTGAVYVNAQGFTAL
jgi:hypothetical protein